MMRLAFGLAALLAPTPPQAEPEDAAPPATEEAEPAEGPATPPAAPQGRLVLDRVLPCGTRVLIARDDSLPVASVVLALEAGSEDDPDDLPGLHHALAYQLLMGNRDTAPGAIGAMVQDAGGIAFLSTGPAQIRFESLIPVTLLGELIVAEARRFRAPTVTESLWKESLVSAKRDVPLRRTTAWASAAIAHGAAGLAHNPRVVPDQLRKLDVATIEAELAHRARYERATMIVVAPLPPQDTLAKVEAAFADLPERARKVPPRTSAPSAKQAIEPKASGNTFIWAIEAEPAARLWADAWCEAISRQRRAKDEPKPNRVRCAFDDDPRRPTLSIRLRTPGDPAELLQARFDRLAGKGERLLRGPRRRLQQSLAAENANPLDLARRLAASPPREDDAPERTSVEVLTGQDALETMIPLEQLIRVETAVRVMPPEPKPEAQG